MTAQGDGGAGQSGGAAGTAGWSAPDLTGMTSELYKHWERGMTAWWDRVLDNPTVLSAMNKGLSQQVAARRGVQDGRGAWLSKMNLPTRADFTQVLRVATLLEERLLSLEDRLLALGDDTRAATKQALTGRVDAAQARVDLAGALSRIEARLAALESRLPPASDTAP